MEITSLELILKLLQDGKITVSEALQLIQDLQSKGDITYVPTIPYYPYYPYPYYKYNQVWCSDGTTTTCGNDGVVSNGGSSVGLSSNFSYAKC